MIQETLALANPPPVQFLYTDRVRYMKQWTSNNPLDAKNWFKPSDDMEEDAVGQNDDQIDSSSRKPVTRSADSPTKLNSKNTSVNPQTDKSHTPNMNVLPKKDKMI